MELPDPVAVREQDGSGAGVTILYAWGDANVGDKAITPGTIQAVREAVPDVPVAVVSISGAGTAPFDRTREYLTRRFPDVEVLPQDWFAPPQWLLFRGGRRLWNLYLSALVRWPALMRLLYARTCTAVRAGASRAVILNGGHLLFWSKRMAQKERILHRYLLPLDWAVRRGTPVVLSGQSFGPFEFGGEDAAKRAMFRSVLEGSQLVLTRETASMGQITHHFGPRASFRTGVDMAFFDRARDEEGADRVVASHDLRQFEYLALTVRLTRRGSRRPLPEAEKTDYARKLAAATGAVLQSAELPLLFVTQHPQDAEDARYVLEHASAKVRERAQVTSFIGSPDQLRSLYARARLLIGMRFHSLVFALTVGTPVVGVCYYDIGPKIRGLMTDLGMADLCHDLSEAEGEAIGRSAGSALARRGDLVRRINGWLDGARRSTLEHIATALAQRAQSQQQTPRNE